MLRTHYKVVQARTAKELEDLVNNWINKREGWVPIGGMVFVQGAYGSLYTQSLKRPYQTKSKNGPSKKELAEIAELKKETKDGIELD